MCSRRITMRALLRYLLTLLRLGKPLPQKRRVYMRLIKVVIATAVFVLGSARGGLELARTAARQEPHTGQPAVVKQVANDLYFFYDYDGSNSVFLVTDAGVLVIDTREHPRAAQDLLSRIRKVTDKPIRWVINSHFHGDHTFGNAAFQAAGATFVAHRETA